ncbi:MAG TPA: glycine cleavage system aminomethyltransferase GcvT [Candidatus Nanoarchaeia archaeon]|nr:glycine cleavage system aminomethyltransferase GcvT [Candidatus Nanoarchaeia archaeon]
MTELKRTPLNEVLKAAGGKFVDFAGWDMPVRFKGDIVEHQAVRTNVGLFDVSHMGEFEVRGRDAFAFLQRLTTNNIGDLVVGKAQYSVMCNENGGIIDDILVYRYEDRYIVVVNAAKIEEDWNWFNEQARGFDVKLEDQSASTILLAVQGRNSLPLLKGLTDADIGSLKRFRFVEGEVAGINATISRTGYTGEPTGFELFASSDEAVKLYKALVQAGEPYSMERCGLGARDSLRLEACLMLNGQDMNPTINPLEAGLHRWVKLDKGEFVGSEAIRESMERGLERTIVGFVMTDKSSRPPRHNYELKSIAGATIGKVTSGGPSISTGKGIGMGYVPAGYSIIGTQLLIDVRGTDSPAVVVERPFYTPN